MRPGGGPHTPTEGFTYAPEASFTYAPGKPVRITPRKPVHMRHGGPVAYAPGSSIHIRFPIGLVAHAPEAPFTCARQAGSHHADRIDVDA